MTTMAIWISLIVVLCLVHVHDSAVSNNGCANEVTVIRSNETQVYSCQARNKDNNIRWISNSGVIQNVLAMCLNGSRTCLTTNSSVSASRTETGRSELMITGRVDGINIECHESSDIKEVNCSQSTTVVTTTTGPGNRNSDNQSTPSAGHEQWIQTPSSTQLVMSMTSAENASGVSSSLHETSTMLSEQFVVKTTFPSTGKSSQYSNENPSSTKTMMTSVSTLKGHLITDATMNSHQTLKPRKNTLKDSSTLKTKSTVSFISDLGTTMPTTPTQVLLTIGRKQVSSVSGNTIELNSQSYFTKLSEQSGITESQSYVSTEIIGEWTLSSGEKLSPTRTTVVSPAMDSSQVEAIEESHIAKYSEVSSQINTRYLVFVSGLAQMSRSTMSSLPLSSEYSFTTEGESRLASTTDAHQNKPHIIASFSPVLIVSSMPFVESSVDHPKGSVSFQDNTKGSYSGESSASVSLTPELPSSTEGSKRRTFTIYPENLTSKISLRTELGFTLTSKIERDGYFTNLETVTSHQNVQEVLGSSAETNKVYLHTSNTFIMKETEGTSRGRTEVIASVKPTLTTSPLHETESTHSWSLTGLSTLNTRNIPTIDTFIASSELKTDLFMFTRSLKTDDVSIHSHQSMTTGSQNIYSNTVLSSTYDRNISVSPDTRTSRSSSLDFSKTTAKNQAGFSDQKTTTIVSAQEELYSTFGQDVSKVTKLPTKFSTHELDRTTIDVQTSSEAVMYNTLNSLPEVRTAIPQIDVQTHRGTSVDTKPAKNNTVDKHPHNILGTTSTTDPIPTSHDQLAHLSLIIGVIAAALGVVVLGSLYILICKHHRDSVTFSDDESAKEFIYCNIAYETGVNDENKKVRDAPSGIDKNEAPLTLKAFRRLSLSKTCVLREEIESPYNMVSTDANSLGKVSTASVSMETDSVSINSSEADYMDIDCPDDVTQQKENQKDFYFPYSVVNRANLIPSPTRKSLIWRPLYDRMLSREDEPEDTLFTAIVIAKPSRYGRSIMKSRGLLEPVHESEEDLLYVAARKPKKVVSFEDAEYATVNKVNHKPKKGEDSKDIQFQDKNLDSLLPPAYATVIKPPPD